MTSRQLSFHDAIEMTDKDHKYFYTLKKYYLLGLLLAGILMIIWLAYTGIAINMGLRESVELDSKDMGLPFLLFFLSLGAVGHAIFGLMVLKHESSAKHTGEVLSDTRDTSPSHFRHETENKCNLLWRLALVILAFIALLDTYDPVITFIQTGTISYSNSKWGVAFVGNEALTMYLASFSIAIILLTASLFHLGNCLARYP